MLLLGGFSGDEIGQGEVVASEAPGFGISQLDSLDALSRLKDHSGILGGAKSGLVEVSAVAIAILESGSPAEMTK